MSPPSSDLPDSSQRATLVRSRWSWRLGTVAGIPIRVHATLVLLLAWIALSYSFRGLGPTATVLGVMLVAVVFAIITVHELAHAVVGRRFGVRTREILLLPIGGIASLEKIPERPAQELAIALVGPAVNIVIAAAITAGLGLSGGALDLATARSPGEAFAIQLVWINLGLAGFNLLPAFPMDGGRALRAVLAMRFGRTRATEIAGGLGKVFAVALGILGLAYNPWLALIAMVVWFGAGQEVELVRIRAAIEEVPVSAAMNREVHAVAPEAPLEEAARLMVATGQAQVPIVDEHGMLGVLTRTDVSAGIATAGATAPVTAAPHHDALPVDLDERLSAVFDRLVRTPEAIAVVVDHGIPVGIITPEQMATFVALRARAA